MCVSGLGGYSLVVRLASNGEEKFELWGELVFGVESVREVDSANTAVSVNLNSVINNK